MPRPRLSSVERRKRAAARTKAWRQRVASDAIPEERQFLPAPYPPLPPLDVEVRHTPAPSPPRSDTSSIGDGVGGGSGSPEDIEINPFLAAEEEDEEEGAPGIGDKDDLELPPTGGLEASEPEADGDLIDDEELAMPELSDGESDTTFFLSDDDAPEEPAAIEELDLTEMVDSELGEADEPGDEALLDAQLLGANSQLDVAAALARQLLSFNGCSAREHAIADMRHHTASVIAPRHLTLAGLSDYYREAQLPDIISQPSFLTDIERDALPVPDWQQIFEGNQTVVEDTDSNSGSSANDSDSDRTIDNDSDGDGDGDEDEEEEDIEIGDIDRPRNAALENSETGASRRRAASEDEASSERVDSEDEGPSLAPDQADVCLDCSTSAEASPAVSYDIDSLLGYTRSLAFARQGLSVNLYPRFNTNIQSNLHLYSTVYHDFGRGVRPKYVPLTSIPHYCLGRVLGREDITLYVFFPRMWHPEKATNFPGKEDGEAHGLLQRWTDRILLPAIFRHVPATSRQHLPASWEGARRKATAYHSERRTRGADEAAAPQSLSLHYPLPASSLAAIWTDVEQRLEDPENHIYGQAQLFFQSLNTKLRFPAPSLAAVWQAFDSSFSAAVDPTYLDRTSVWIDVGKEMTDLDYALPDEGLASGSVPSSYLLRACCQASLARWARLEAAPSSVKATFYPVAMLRDACNVTLEMSRTSPQRLQGWPWAQSYCSCKEIYDAAKTKPFDSPFLGHLAWDADVERMLRRQGKGSAATSKQLAANYLRSKQRLYRALQDARRLSFGVREEHRISLALFDRIRTWLEANGAWEVEPELTSDCLIPIWFVPTADWTAYLQGNANKYLAAIEWIRCLEAPGRISYDHCQLLTMLLHALPYTFDAGPIDRRTAIWQPQFQRRRGGPEVLGMGLADTIAATGYGWLLRRVDWGALAFRRRSGIQTAFASSMLRDTYRRNWEAVKDSKDSLARIEAAAEWLRLYSDAPRCRAWIETYLVVTVVQAYRRCVYGYLKARIAPAAQPYALSGKAMLCGSTVDDLLGEGYVLGITPVDVRRSKIKTIEQLVNFLWDFDDGQRRDSWESLPFRVLYQAASRILEGLGGVSRATIFRKSVKRYFVATNWLIPQPTATKFIQRNHSREICWFAIYHRRLAFSAANRYRTVNASQLLPLAQRQPTRWRPTLPPWRDALWLLRESGFDAETKLVLATEPLRPYPRDRRLVSDADAEQAEEEEARRLTDGKKWARRYGIDGEKWLPDWDFDPPRDEGTLMHLIPKDPSMLGIPWDASLPRIIRKLRGEWEVWRQGDPEVEE